MASSGINYRHTFSISKIEGKKALVKQHKTFGEILRSKETRV